MSMICKTLGHYQVRNQIGRGGMGEVYQAKDQKLGRDVAIKVLPEEFAKDADRVLRFQREAKLLASLNHPNIAAIYGLEESGGTSFLVLELVEGDTLADRIKAGPVPVEESLKLALQIAEALEAAHEKGVIHRDLKPANIKVTPDGKVKVLDFGLAKAFAAEQAELNLSNSPTLSNAATQQGVILGTAAYMSPEQARGETVDKRADIWAFGCVLFEMLTGRGMFEGRTVSDTLAAVLMREPEWKRLPPNLHPRIRLLLERCLEKEAKNRYSGIGDARVDIQKALSDPSGVLVQPVTTEERRSKLRTIFPWVAAAIVLSLVVGGVAVWKLKPAEPRQVMRFEYDLPEGQQFNGGLAVSPDGKQFVYSTWKGLYLRSVDESTAKLISGTEGNTQQPFFSPNGKWIGYRSEGDIKLKKIAIGGGAPAVLCDAPTLLGASWGPDNTIVYGSRGNGIMRVSANGGTPECIVKEESGSLASPQILSGGESVLYTVLAGDQSSIVVQFLKSGQPKKLFAGVGARYLPTGHIVYGVGNNLLAVPFDTNKLEVSGGPVPVVDGVIQITVPQYAFSDSGTLVYIPGTTAAEPQTGSTLVWVDRSGKEEPLGAPVKSYFTPKVSPDGTRVALTIYDNDMDIWIWDLVRKILTRLTFDKSNELQPIWTPDGKRIVFGSSRDGPYGIYWKAADGTGKEEKLVAAPDRSFMPYSFSRDGKILLMDVVKGILNPSSANLDIGTLSMESERTSKPLLQENYVEAQAQISPDGKYMAYLSSESGQGEVYVRPFPEVDKGKWQVSTNGGASARWSPDGRELLYLSSDNSMMTIAVKTEPPFSLGTPKILFKSIYAGTTTYSGIPWDIQPDGKRFLMMKETESTPSAAGGPRKINIVLNWFEELKQRVPVK